MAKVRSAKLVAVFVAVLVLLHGLALAGRSCERPRKRHVGHQLPYRWDAYYLPRTDYNDTPMEEVIATVNRQVAAASSGAVLEAIKFDFKPAAISKVGVTPDMTPQVEALIARHREYEKKVEETCRHAPSTMVWIDGHSLGCLAMLLVNMTPMVADYRDDALHLCYGHEPLEVRVYAVTDGLRALERKLQAEQQYLVDAPPCVSALVKAGGFHRNWSIMLPSGPNSATSDCCLARGFALLPDPGLVLVLTTAQEHTEGEKRLKAAGLWADPPSPPVLPERPADGGGGPTD